MALRPGSIVNFANKGHSFLTSAQKLITHEWIDGVSPKKFKQGDKTHTAMIWYPEAGEDAVFEAYLCSTIDPWRTHKGNTKYWVFDPYFFSDGQIREALYYEYNRDASSDYGFLELLWFPYRYIMEVFHKDVRHQHNWFPGGNICSQDFFHYAYYLGKFYQPLRDYLDQWRDTTFHSSDTWTVLTKFPNLFRLTEQQL